MKKVVVFVVVFLIASVVSNIILVQFVGTSLRMFINPAVGLIAAILVVKQVEPS